MRGLRTVFVHETTSYVIVYFSMSAKTLPSHIADADKGIGTPERAKVVTCYHDESTVTTPQYGQFSLEATVKAHNGLRSPNAPANFLNDSFSQSNNLPIYRQSIDQSINQSINQFIRVFNLSANKTTCQSTNQLINHSNNNSII